MKTCVLIVRLFGLWLLFTSIADLYKAYRVKSMGVALGQVPLGVDVVVISACAALVGLAAAIYAGGLARALTFDSGRGD